MNNCAPCASPRRPLDAALQAVARYHLGDWYKAFGLRYNNRVDVMPPLTGQHDILYERHIQFYTSVILTEGETTYIATLDDHPDRARLIDRIVDHQGMKAALNLAELAAAAPGVVGRTPVNWITWEDPPATGANETWLGALLWSGDTDPTNRVDIEARAEGLVGFTH